MWLVAVHRGRAVAIMKIKVKQRNIEHLCFSASISGRVLTPRALNVALASFLRYSESECDNASEESCIHRTPDLYIQ